MSFLKRRFNSDTDALVNLLCVRGSSVLRELRGMFAGVLLNAKNGEVELAFRDIAGIKPLFVHRSNSGYIYSSEVSAILNVLPTTPSLDKTGIEDYRVLRMCTGRRTFYDGISTFPPACYETRGQTEHYWLPDFSRKAHPSAADLMSLIEDSVRAHEVSDVEIATLVSGGIDSNAITALSSAKSCWTVGTAENNEFAEAAESALKLGKIHHAVLYNYDDFVSDARQLIRRRREPLIVPNEVLLARLFCEAKGNGASVFLSGEGADEIFGGYSRIFQWASSASNFKIADFLNIYGYGDQSRIDVAARALEPYLSLSDPYIITTAFFFHEHLHALLRRLDFASMAFGVEVRVPFVDTLVVNRMLGVRPEHGSVGKKTNLRQAFEALLGDQIAWRNKVGFPVDLNLALRRGLRRHPSETREYHYTDWFDFNLNTLQEA